MLCQATICHLPFSPRLIPLLTVLQFELWRPLVTRATKSLSTRQRSSTLTLSLRMELSMSSTRFSCRPQLRLRNPRRGRPRGPRRGQRRGPRVQQRSPLLRMGGVLLKRSWRWREYVVVDETMEPGLSYCKLWLYFVLFVCQFKEGTRDCVVKKRVLRWVSPVPKSSFWISMLDWIVSFDELYQDREK